MNCWRTAAVGYFRSARKRFTISGSLCLMLVLLLATQSHCRPSDEEEVLAAGSDEYADVDNVEWHHVKIVDGVMREDHPVVMYKEDYVSEDYDPTKNRTTSARNTTESAVTRPQRKYKDIAHRRRRLNRTDTEQYRALKPEKMYFDVLPQVPLVVADDSGADNSKFDASKMRVDVISLIDDASNEKTNVEEEPSKQMLSKRPKKFHSRTRRDIQTDGKHVVHKRNPYIRHHQSDVNSLSFDNFIDSIRRQIPRQTYTKHTVPGNRWNDPYDPVYVPVAVSGVQTPQSIVNRFDDGQVWGRIPQSSTRPTRPSVQRTTPSIFHNADPSNADFSFNRQTSTSRPTNVRTTPSLFHNADPQYADFSFLNQDAGAPIENGRFDGNIPLTQWDSQAQSSSLASSRRAPENFFPPRIQQFGPKCAQAINSCCNDQIDVVRYNCFQILSCERTIAEIINFCDN